MIYHVILSQVKKDLIQGVRDDLVGGGGESELLKVPRASKQNPTKALDQKLTIPKNPMLFQLFPLKGEDTEPSS